MRSLPRGADLMVRDAIETPILCDLGVVVEARFQGTDIPFEIEVAVFISEKINKQVDHQTRLFIVFVMDF
jgi:hypothetical protein